MGKMEETTEAQRAIAATYLKPEKGTTNIGLFCETLAALALLMLVRGLQVGTCEFSPPVRGLATLLFNNFFTSATGICSKYVITLFFYIVRHWHWRSHTGYIRRRHLTGLCGND
jgi:hypothetical protein